MSTNGVNADGGHAWPKDVGILAMDIYFPSTFVDQVNFYLKYQVMCPACTILVENSWQRLKCSMEAH